MSDLSQKQLTYWLSQVNNILNNEFPGNSHLDNQPSCIIDNWLYVGDFEDANNISILNKLGIHYVLNCAGDDTTYMDIHRVTYPSHFNVHSFNALDIYNYSIIDNHIQESIQFINECKQNGDRILIHCMAGMNRSPTIAIAYMMSQLNMDLLTSIQLFVKQRPWILSNKSFKQQLILYAHKIGKLKHVKVQLKSKL